jgi:hypothetical protein
VVLHTPADILVFYFCKLSQMLLNNLYT